MKNKQVTKCVLLAVLALFMLFVTILGGRAFLPASAATTSYSGVLDDLQKDESFNTDDYPYNSDDYSINVIQIAESTDGELLIYTYQPCQLALYLVATEINMALYDTVDGTMLYSLTLLSSTGVFCKYKVNNFTVKADEVRYYNISTIYRDYDKYADGNLDRDKNTAIAYPVGQVWTARNVGDDVEYTNEHAETITITGCYYGTVRVPNGYNWMWSSSQDAHVIFFNTDIRMDKLLEADVAYKYRDVASNIYGNDTYVGEWQPAQTTIKHTDKGMAGGSVFGSNSTKIWDRIQTSEEFIKTLASFKDVEIPAYVLMAIQKFKWVLNYANTDYKDSIGGVSGWLVNGWAAVAGGGVYSHVETSDATILRLEFVTDGVHYNLGTVMNKTGKSEVIAGGDSTFFGDVKGFFTGIWDKITGFFKSIPWWVWVIVGIVVLGGGISLLCYFVPAVGKVVIAVLKAIWKGIKWFFKKLWWIICLPFRGIAALFKKSKEKSASKSKSAQSRSSAKRSSSSTRKRARA